MTRPLPHDRTDDPEELRKRWLLRFLRVESKYESQIRTVLIHGAEDAYSELLKTKLSSTFSAGVKSAQIRLVMKEVGIVLHDVFGELLPIIKDGQGDAARAAVDAFSETDRAYLIAAFTRSGNVDSFVDGQRRQAALHVVNAINNLRGRERYQLSTQVYRTRTLANTWVRRQVTSGIMRGASAHEIAKSVRSSIRPTTAGGASYAALRLGRTELNNAFHATAIDLAQDRPWVEGMLWHLSKTHDFDLRCLCERYAGQIFEVNNVPEKPHPQCRCFVTPQIEPFDVFMRHLTAGQYRDWMSSAA